MSSSIAPFPSGVIPASVTPMHDDHKANINLLASHCTGLLFLGADGIVLLGTTGEANSFSASERMEILEGILKVGVDPQRLMVGTGCNAITDTIQLTSHAVSCGVHNVLMLPPFYYKPVSDNALYNYFATIIEKVSSEHAAIYLYHIPQNTGIDLSVNLISRLIQDYPKTIVGLKDSSGDWDHIFRMITEFPSFRVYSGTEEYLLQTLRAGGVGCISATANLTIALATTVHHAFRLGENTDELYQRLIALRHVFKGYPHVASLKGFLALESGNDTWLNMRLPNEPLDRKVIEGLSENYARLNTPSYA